jgi:hypothetical protein
MPLLQLPTVRDLTGLRRDEIFDRVDGASLLHRGFAWVWDIAPLKIRNQKLEIRNQNPVRNLRFWRAEVLAYGGPDDRKYGDYELAWVINQILPPGRRHFHSGEVLQMFALSRNSLQRLRAELNGQLAGARSVMFTRENLAAFLQRRWLGAAFARGSGISGLGSGAASLNASPDARPRTLSFPARTTPSQTYNPGREQSVAGLFNHGTKAPSTNLSAFASGSGATASKRSEDGQAPEKLQTSNSNFKPRTCRDGREHGG